MGPDADSGRSYCLAPPRNPRPRPSLGRMLQDRLEHAAEQEVILLHLPMGKELQGPNLQKLLLLLLLNAVAAVSGYSVSGFLGEQVVLPCTYKGNVPVSELQVIWWIFKRGVLHNFVDGNDDLTQQDPQFRNRTNLFKDQLEQGNWSLMISDLRQSDQNEYRCQILQRSSPVFHQVVHLSVTERARTPVPNTPVPVSGFLGEQVVLPCIYKGNVPVSELQVIWWISNREILHKFIDGNDDLTQQDPQFRNRTNLFQDQLEQGNWSLMISDLRQSDQNEYQCQIYKRIGEHYQWQQTDSVHLSVTGPGPSTGAVVGLVVGILFLLLLQGFIVFIIQKRQRWNCVQKHHSINQNEASHVVPLTGVTCLGHKVPCFTTAPEHQNGAAGEQNLLGNGAVQH
ncbi:CD276 antigen homolog isoform X1 [Heterodontus francisci]|uniref:CD276 antigen homolog isoform X1 n=1 Tax=Heterodontus francisci TaxID=7792 RepID=UPI00355C75C4